MDPRHNLQVFIYRVANGKPESLYVGLDYTVNDGHSAASKYKFAALVSTSFRVLHLAPSKV